MEKRFLIVDDDPVNNLITKRALKTALGDVHVKDYTIPEDGLDHIQTAYQAEDEDQKTVLLLDINMPSMTGWEFLEKFEQFEDYIKSKFDIYILSSSVDPRDHQKASENQLVMEFIEKPLGNSVILKMFG